MSNREDPIQNVARSLELLLRLKIEEIRGDRSQTEMIGLLGRLGATAAEIAAMLGAEVKTVAPILSRAKGSGKKKSRAGARANRRGR